MENQTQTMSTKTRPKPRTLGSKGYKGHRDGSRKGAVHKLYDEEGRDAASEKGLELGLKSGTLITWFSIWARADKAHQKTA